MRSVSPPPARWRRLDARRRCRARWRDDRTLVGEGQQGVRGALLDLDAATGRAALAGQHAFGVEVTDARGQQARRTVELTIDDSIAQEPALTPPEPPAADA